uniref:Major facilitator superfamily (MFS) profile domain-containing protein n=1 Tax=Timema cristinae TaxID=61476 RepID=A0A7R9D7K6_TIMCR|nr:unnamed protein product [Timema cristinae]
MGFSSWFSTDESGSRQCECVDQCGHCVSREWTSESSVSTSEYSICVARARVVCMALGPVAGCLFQESPPLPPSAAQAVQRAAETTSFVSSLRRLMGNPGYILLLVSYGINVGVFYAISTLLNQVILSHYQNATSDAGRIGLTIVLAGMVGSAISGFVLDKTHKFKETTLVLYGLSLVCMVIFTFTLNCGNIGVVYFTAGLLGFFMTGYLPVGFELAAELTYPEPEGTSAGILNAAVQVFGIALTSIYGWQLDLVGDRWTNVTMCVILAVGAVLTFIIKSDLRRQAATKHNNRPDDQ